MASAEGDASDESHDGGTGMTLQEELQQASSPHSARKLPTMPAGTPCVPLSLLLCVCVFVCVSHDNTDSE